MENGTGAAKGSSGTLTDLLAAFSRLLPPRETIDAHGDAGRRPLDAEERRLKAALAAHVEKLADEIGPRGVFHNPTALVQAACYIERALQRTGFDVIKQRYEVEGIMGGKVACENLIAEIPGTERPDENVVVGAHYDTVPDSPGANDNGSGVATLLCLAETLRAHRPKRTLRFAAFTNEEPPFFKTEWMGSYVYATTCRERGDHIVGMVSLETIGYYSDAPGSQRVPEVAEMAIPQPHRNSLRGDFITFVGLTNADALINTAVDSFQRHAPDFPARGAAFPAQVAGEPVEYVDWSDHWSFACHGYPAFMITDTAPLRYDHYHMPTDTPEKIDYDRLARLIKGLEGMLLDLSMAV